MKRIDRIFLAVSVQESAEFKFIFSNKKAVVTQRGNDGFFVLMMFVNSFSECTPDVHSHFVSSSFLDSQNAIAIPTHSKMYT
jgi:hypothetical protein